MERLFLIDGTALAYRSHFAFARNPLTNSRGENTSAVFGFANTLLQILEEEKPDHVAVAFDGPDPTFRHERFEEYKATREKMPDDLVTQLGWIRDLVEGMRIPFIIESGYEADDVIGTLARWAGDRGIATYLVGSDKDFMQLVDEKTRIMVLRRGGRDELGPPEVKEKFGVPPEKVCDVLALMGDSSDNVPGVPGVGPKGAVKLIDQFGSLEEVLAHADEVKSSRVRTALLENTEQARLSLDLVRIRTDVPLSVGWEDLALGEPDRERLTRLFSEVEFESLLKRFTGVQEKDSHTYHTVMEMEDLEVLLGEIREAGEFILDLETTSLDALTAEIVGVAVSLRDREAHYIPFREGVLEAMRPILEDPAIRKGGQNIKYDLQVLRNYDVEVRGLTFDTMVASFLIDSTHRQHNLDSLSLRYLSFKKIATRDLLGSGESEKTMLEVPLEDVARYACEDADITHRLQTVFSPRLEEIGVDRLFRDVEIPLVEVLRGMEREGIGLDLGPLESLSKRLEGEIARATARVHELAGEEFNVASPQQLGQILFERMEIQKTPGAPRVRRTKTGYSTAASVLEQFSGQPIVKEILEVRTLSKLKNTYLDALPRFLHPRTGRIHTSFHQTGAATGRLSSSEPNLQNIPIRSETGREIRAAFVPGREGHLLLSADYSQIELRVLAHLSGDASLITAFEGDEDVHRRTAATIFGVEPEDVSGEMRSRAKVVNYGIVYGMGPQRLARETGCKLEEAKAFIEAYLEKYPAIEGYIEEQKRKARQDGHVTTLLGRRRAFPDIHARNRAIQQNAERAAVNTPIQGTAADIIKVAMIQIDREMRDRSMASRMLLQVHDELVFTSPEDEIDDLRDLVRERMEGCMDLKVPLQVDIGEGRNWLEAH